jgi:hypothetical protein
MPKVVSLSSLSEILILFDLSAISYLVALLVSSTVNGSTNPFTRLRQAQSRRCTTLAQTRLPDGGQA